MSKTNFEFTPEEKRGIGIIVEKFKKAKVPTRGLQTQIMHEGLGLALPVFNKRAEHYLKIGKDGG